MSVAGIASGAPLRHAPRWLLGALFTSLAVNLIVIGLVAGALWRFHAPVSEEDVCSVTNCSSCAAGWEAPGDDDSGGP